MTKGMKSIKDDIVQIFQNGGIKADAARYISEKLGLGKTQSKEWAKHIHDECCVFGVAEFDENLQNDLNSSYDEGIGDYLETTETETETDLEFSDKYVYNKNDDVYLFLLEKKFGKNIVIKGDRIRGLITNYSNYDENPESINEVSTKYEIPRKYLLQILKILGITHDSLPFTPEQIVEEDVDILKDKCISGKRFALNQKLQKEGWKATNDDARKWNEFLVGKYNPFVDAIDTWSAPKLQTLPNLSNPKTNTNVFVCILTDTHIGELTKNCWTGNTFNTEKAVDNILNYVNQIRDKLDTWVSVPSKCKLVIMGDILNSCVDGMTRRGTKLHNDVVNGDMFKVGLDVIITFVSSLKQMFNVVDISCVNGNHDSFMIGAVYYSASKYFEQNDKIIWNISDYWLDSFKVNNCYFIYTHGKDDVNHIGLPNTRPKLESFVQSLLLKRVEDLVGIQSKYFITGHLHSYVHEEMNDFEYIRVPSSVTADEFAESLGYMTKARQNCFVVGQNHIEDTLHFYFE